MGQIVSAVAQIQPYLGAVSTVLNVVNDFDNARSAEKEARKSLEREQNLALKQLKALQKNQTAAAQQNAALERSKISAETEQIEKDRQAALRRAVARQNNMLASKGFSTSDGGSAEAILLGLFEESEEEKASRQKYDTLRQQALDLGLSQKKSANILARQQLKEKQELERASLF